MKLTPMIQKQIDDFFSFEWTSECISYSLDKILSDYKWGLSKQLKPSNRLVFNFFAFKAIPLKKRLGIIIYVLCQLKKWSQKTVI